MLDDILATDPSAPHTDAAASPKNKPVLEARQAPLCDPAGTRARDLKPMPALDLKLQPADAFFASPGAENESEPVATDELPAPPREPVTNTGAPRRSPSDEDEIVPAGRAGSAVGRVLRSVASVLGIAALCGLAWAAGAHQFPGHSTAPLASRAPELQGSAQHDELVGAVRQMGEDLRALAARVDAKGAAQNASPDAAPSAATSKAVADLAGRVAEMDATLTAKLARVDERLAAIEQRASAPHATEVARAQPPRHHAKHIHDAFDPSRDPDAPGAPRPLGR